MLLATKGALEPHRRLAVPMSDKEKLKLHLEMARNLSMQHRWPEAKLMYEKIIDALVAQLESEQSATNR